MKGGCLNLVESGAVDTDPFPREWQENEETLRSSVKAGRFTEPLRGVHRVREGTAMKEYIAEAEDRYINENGELDSASNVTKSVAVSEFIEVPGSFIVTERTDDELPRSVLRTATGDRVCQSEIDVRQFRQQETLDVTHAATDGTIEAGYLEAVDFSRQTGNLPSELQDEPEILVGFENLQWNGRWLREILTRSGYVEVYEPDIGSEEFAQFLSAVVLPYAS